MEALRKIERRGQAWDLGWHAMAGAFSEDLAARGYSSYTLRDYRGDVLKMGLKLGVPPVEIGLQHLPTVREILLQSGLTLSARRRHLSAFRRFVAFLESKREQSPLGPRLLHTALRESPNDHLLVALIYFAGLRMKEVAHLEGRDIRLRKGSVTSRLGYRLLPLHPVLLAIVRSMRFHAPLVAYRPVLPGYQGFALNARTLHGRFQRIAQEAGLAGTKPDHLRREVSAHLLAQNTPRGLVKAFLGRDRGQPIAPRKGRLVDLSCLRSRLEELPV